MTVAAEKMVFLYELLNGDSLWGTLSLTRDRISFRESRYSSITTLGLRPSSIEIDLSEIDEVDEGSTLDRLSIGFWQVVRPIWAPWRPAYTGSVLRVRLKHGRNLIFKLAGSNKDLTRQIKMLLARTGRQQSLPSLKIRHLLVPLTR
jgi:hypothetical protein